MTDVSDKRSKREPSKSPSGTPHVFSGKTTRRELLRQASKAAYVAPTMTLLTLIPVELAAFSPPPPPGSQAAMQRLRPQRAPPDPYGLLAPQDVRPKQPKSAPPDPYGQFVPKDDGDSDD